MKRRRLKKNETLIPFLVILLIITCSATLLGYFGTRYIVYPIFLEGEPSIGNVENKSTIPETAASTNNEAPKETDSAAVQQISSTQSEDFIIYNVQLGNFSSKENADILIGELEQDDIYAYILGDKGYKVVTSPVMDYAQADVIKNKVIKYAQDAFVLKRKVYVEDEAVESSVKNIINRLHQVKTEQSLSEENAQELKEALNQALNNKNMEEKTITSFQNMYDEVNKIKDYPNNELFELEKMIIMKVEEIL